MADYKKQGFGGGSSFKRPFSKGGSSFGSRPSYGRDSREQREQFDAQCAGCNQQCKVPFRPNGKKPVYCANCFTKDDSRNDSRSQSQGNSHSTYSRDARPARPSYEKPASVMPDRQIQELTKQIEVMNTTMQRLVSAVDAMNRSSELSTEVRKHLPKEAPATEVATPKKSAAKSVAKPVKKAAKAAKPAKKAAKKK